MFKVTRKQIINTDVFVMEIEAPPIAQTVRPGQHVDIHVNPDGAALTLPVASYDREKNTITLVHRVQDLPSTQMVMLREGDELFQVRGPLGGACRIDGVGKVVLAGEDLGAASLFARAREYKNKGAYTIVVLGFETKDEVYWESEFAAFCDELYVCTRDGSYGVNGRITNPLRAVLEAHRDVERLIVIGQLSKMRKIAKLAVDYGIPAYAAFDAIRPAVGVPNVFDVDTRSQEVFAFARAPELDMADVDFDKLIAREKSLRDAGGAEAG
jgi:NAD(P)H-flavin reductase